MRVTLRPFAPTDLPLLSDWERAINAAQYMSRTRPKPSSLGPGDGTQPLWFVIEVDDTPAGTLWLERGETLNEAALGILLGDQAVFGRGIGQRAIALAIEHLNSLNGLTRVTLNVRSNNIRAIACYERCGFKIARTSERQQGEGTTFMYHTMILDLS
jgi:RimJ/RimL family protein N-acetyltransferase